jgi:predicted cupin superfamily sugar epimerase
MTGTYDTLLRKLNLQPHPEGGHFSQTYRSALSVYREGATTPSSAATAIYYLLGAGDHSAWHRLRSDEVWHFYAGDSLLVYQINAAGELETHRLGNVLDDPAASFQILVPAGQWFAAECAQGGQFALVGCTVSPGFEFSEFELADSDTLQATYPRHRQIIARLCVREGQA